MYQPDKDKERRDRAQYTIDLSDGGVFQHYSGLQYLFFEYGLAQFSSSPPTVTIAVTVAPMTHPSTSYSVNVSADDFIDLFEKSTNYQATDIFKIFIIGIDQEIRTLVSSLKQRGINPNFIYSYDIDRLSHGYLSTWEFNPESGYIRVPRIHN